MFDWLEITGWMFGFFYFNHACPVAFSGSKFILVRALIHGAGRKGGKKNENRKN